MLPEILPAFVQGWLLFLDSGLDTVEPNVLHDKLKNDFDVRSVEAALRKHWADADLRRRDQTRGRHMANLADDEDFLAGEMDLDILETEGYTQEMDVLAAEQERVEEGMAMIQEGRRTLKEARNRQHAVKMSPQFYRVPPPPLPGGQAFRRDPLRPRPGHGKGSIKCLRCGGPHKVAVCPERNKGEVPQPKPQANSAEEEATFTLSASKAWSAVLDEEVYGCITTRDVVGQGKAEPLAPSGRSMPWSKSWRRTSRRWAPTTSRQWTLAKSPSSTLATAPGTSDHDGPNEGTEDRAARDESSSTERAIAATAWSLDRLCRFP